MKKPKRVEPKRIEARFKEDCALQIDQFLKRAISLGADKPEHIISITQNPKTKEALRRAEAGRQFDVSNAQVDAMEERLLRRAIIFKSSLSDNNFNMEKLNGRD